MNHPVISLVMVCGLTRTITTIVSRVSGRVEQVGDETVFEGGTEGEDMVSSSRKVASGKE